MQLVIAGHLLLFSTRAGRFFFEPPFPESRFFWAIVGTQVVAALMSANGWLLTPISWRLIGFIWIYNLVWVVVIDAIKVALYHHFDARDSEQTEIAKPLDPFEAGWAGSARSGE